MNDLITIVINVYNGENFIAKCIDSIVCQTYENLEILIVNDGSTDDTLKICQKYKDERIRIISQENMGLSIGRNTGIENAKGKYIYFVDADDFVEKDVIEYLYKLCINYKVKIASCKPLDIYDYNFKVKQEREKVEVLSSEEMLKMILLSKNRSVTTWNKLMDRELFDNIRFENRIMDDMVVTHKLVIKAEKIAYSNQIKYYFLRHSKSITANGKVNIDRYIDNYKASVERYNYIKERYPDMVENNVFMVENVIRLYLDGSKELRDYLDNNNARDYLNKRNVTQIMSFPINIRRKIKIVLFMANSKLCFAINELYKSKKYKYKI
ncbi:MAG: glycosyltransferase [Clostridia bacterium]|nr:glycosyltransferase [Clostridia bacterium]